ncbi:MAG: hypothetical protein WCI73_17545, partial [Phycisphaerae bacterium]
VQVGASMGCRGFWPKYAVGLSVSGAKGKRGGGVGEAHPPRPGREQRALLLETLALMDLKGDAVAPTGVDRADTAGMAYPDLSRNNGAIRGGVCWLVVTLTGQDAVGDLIPAGAVPVVLALDAPGSESWIGFAQKTAT